MHGLLIFALWLAGAPALQADADLGRSARQASSTCDAAAVAEFTDRLRTYLLLRHDAAPDLSSERLFDDPSEMLFVRDALRRSIRDARPDARAGNLFTPRAAAAFRHMIAATAAAHHIDPKDLVRELRAERLPGAKQPAVNHAYDWRLGAWMWPALLQVLPTLPPDLQYRIVDDDLVLIDLRANLVVDILEHAMEVDEDCS
jgi:hypothetical protein